jgi:hypothetical protein
MFGFGICWGPILPLELLQGVDREPEDPDEDNDEDAPGARFNECTETIHDPGEDDDGDED